MLKFSTVTFTKDIDRFVAKAKGRARAFAIESIQDLNEEVVIGTGEGYGIKVVTGFLRGAWFASIGGGSPAGAGSADPSGAASIARLNLVTAGIQIGQTFHAANGAAYAGFVHFGTVRMGPRPWVQQIVRTRWAAIAEAAAERVAALP